MFDNLDATKTEMARIQPKLLSDKSILEELETALQKGNEATKSGKFDEAATEFSFIISVRPACLSLFVCT